MNMNGLAYFTVKNDETLEKMGQSLSIEYIEYDSNGTN